MNTNFQLFVQNLIAANSQPLMSYSSSTAYPKSKLNLIMDINKSMSTYKARIHKALLLEIYLLRFFKRAKCFDENM